MKRPIDIKTTFEEIRRLPLEVTFTQIESWVYKQKIESNYKNNWINLFLVKGFSRSKN